VKEKERDKTGRGLSFGSHLKAMREKKGLSLSDLCLETRLTAATVLLLEKEDWERLPPPAFVKGFVKAYAGAVGADTETVLAMYQKALEKALPAATDGFRAATAAAWMLQLTVLAAFTLLVAALVFMICLPGEDAGWKPGAQSAMPQARVAGRPEIRPAKILRIKMTALSDTWVRVMADGVEIGRFELIANQTINLTAKREFNLLLGKPEDIRLSLDGKPVPVASKAGQAVNLKLP